MLAGILSGAAIHEYASSDAIQAWSENITLLTDIFLRLIKMVIAPLVFSTLTVGIMNTVHLNNVVARLKKVKDVLTVTRN